MMRHAQHSIVFIDKPVKEHECGHNFNMAVWDPDEGFCFRLFQVENSGNVRPVPDDIADKLWDEPYNMDKLEVYRNAYDCWVDSEGEVGDPEYVEGLGEDELPKCFFGMKVIMGTYLKNGFANAEIRLSKWMDQGEGEKWDRQW